MTSKELEKELYDSIESYVSKIHESVKNKNEFIKHNRKDWEHWKKHAKKNKSKHFKKSDLSIKESYDTSNSLVKFCSIIMLTGILYTSAIVVIYS